MSSSVEKKLIIWFGVILVMLFANTILSYRSTLIIIATNDMVTHTYQVLSELDKTISTLTDAESGQRGFLLTDTDSYLEPYKNAVATELKHVHRLSELTADNPNQQRLLVELEQKVNDRLSQLEENIKRRRQGGIDATREVILSNKGKNTMDEIRHIIARMSDTENELLNIRRIDSDVSKTHAHFTFFITGLLAAGMLAIFYYQVKRGIRDRAVLLEHEQAARTEAEIAYKAEQQARSEAETANRIKDEFLATISHELRTPLNAILGWSRMLRAGTLDEETSIRALDTIERNAKSQAQLIEDLLDVSRIISGKFRLDVRPVELVSVIEASIDVVRPAADARDIRIHKVIDPEAGVVSGDPERLQQVLWNLLSNAVKFTPKGGRVEVRLERMNFHVEIVVSDTGKGISADFLPHVFELFRQADNSISRIHSGLGLGLAIARSIVEMHGGAIRADSAGENQGAVFTVSLPLRAVRSLELFSDSNERAHPTASYKMPFDKLPALDGLRILAVDDQPDTREMIKTALAQCGAEVRTADTAHEAFEVLRVWKPDLLVADIGMPEEDGYSLISKIRALKQEDGGMTPAVALTAYARVEDRMKTLSAGYQMHVPKPVEPVELATIIASLTGRIRKSHNE